MAISSPITERKDIVLEFDWETNGDGNNYMQFAPWSPGDPYTYGYGFSNIAFNYNWSQLLYNLTPEDGVTTLTVQDLTVLESEPQTVGQYAYGFIQGYRYRLTFEVNGDMYIAKRPIGSNVEFIDELRLVDYYVAPDDISESNPRYFRFHMFQYIVLGDLLLRYEDGTVIQQVLFDREHVFAFANKYTEPGYFTSDHGPGVIYENKPYLKDLTTDEKIISETVIEDSTNIPAGTRIMTLDGIYDKYDFEAGKVLNFLFGLPKDLEEAKKADHNTAGVSCLSLQFDGQNWWAYMYYGGESHGPGGGIAINNEFSIRADKNEDGTTQLILFSITDNSGRVGMTVPSISGRVAIQVGGTSASNASGIRFTKLNLSTLKFFDGTDKAVNFNSYDDTAINAKIDSEDWSMFATPASQFVDSTYAKGLHVTQEGELFFEGTSDNTYFAPSGQYGNFVLEFDYYDFKNKPEQVESWPVGYSPLGISIGREAPSQGWTAAGKLVSISTNVSLQVFDEGASAVNSEDIDFKDVWTRIKIVAIDSKISVYTASLEGKTYTDITAADYTLVAEAQYKNTRGYVSICGTEGAYYKLDNIRITNIDGKESSFVDNVAIADAYEVTITATANNDSLGTVTGTQDVAPGTSVTISATASEYCTFEGWYADGIKVSDTAEYTFTATTVDQAFVAQFAKIKYTVTANAENGSVEGAGEYDAGTEATLTATANKYYKFVMWTVNGQDAGTNATITFTVEGNCEYTAIFEIIRYTVTATAENGSVEGAGEYDAGSSVTLTATASAGYEFVKWTVNGQDAGTEATVTFTVEGDCEYTAIFETIKYTVTANAENGSVEGAGEYEAGASATLTATANKYYKFVKWTVNGQDAGTNATITFTVEGDCEYTAIFEIIRYTVTATAENGSVEGAGEYDAGSSVTLTATATEGYEIDGWYVGEEKFSDEATYTFTLEGDITVVVKFVEKTPTTPTESGSQEGDNEGGCASGIGGIGFAFMLSLVAGVKIIRKKQD